MGQVATSKVISGQADQHRMSFKRKIQSSCKVEPCNTKQERDLPKNKDFLQLPFFISKYNS
ncbi:hypothetical protein CFP56_038464 [Quercus suber]|uniref:Uncharacterized protein n=1 Tax=Quercus suber TaxID=58331 RepID=A0AAW0J2X7_QUESU